MSRCSAEQTGIRKKERGEKEKEKKREEGDKSATVWQKRVEVVTMNMKKEVIIDRDRTWYPMER